MKIGGSKKWPNSKSVQLVENKSIQRFYSLKRISMNIQQIKNSEYLHSAHQHDKTVDGSIQTFSCKP